MSDNPQKTTNTTPSQVQSRTDLVKDKSHHKDGRFINPWDSFTNPPFTLFFKYMVSSVVGNPATKSLKEGRLPKQVSLDRTAIENPSNVQVTWLGHASLLVQLDGATVLCDPVFSKRCSPTQLIGPSRYTSAPATVAKLPEIDVLVLSHNHYDHMDWNTLKDLVARFPDLPVYAPLGNEPFLKSVGFKHVTMADWWEEFQVPLKQNKSLTLACTPAQHMTNRGLTDQMATLWSSWSMLGPDGHRFFFSGDTAYSAVHNNPTKAHCPVFAQIGEVYGPFDLAAIAIGAYGPETLFGGMHTNPEQAVLIHEEIRSKKSIGIHWGTFILTAEPIDEPPKRLEAEMKSRGHNPDDFSVLPIGGTTTG
ncbi:Protein-lysine N-methyltransferase efm4 [Coemansia sp. RSA 1365]|nr:Protein-lysine N-methyltransferase efm4 [Coemansia sp. RSA 1365]